MAKGCKAFNSRARKSQSLDRLSALTRLRARPDDCGIERAQRLVRRHVKPGTSLVDELIAERREAARNE